jgi:hypothetical protein
MGALDGAPSLRGADRAALRRSVVDVETRKLRLGGETYDRILSVSDVKPQSGSTFVRMAKPTVHHTALCPCLDALADEPDRRGRPCPPPNKYRHGASDAELSL